MAKFLDTRKAASELADLIRNAEATLTLISPYLKLSKDFRELLTYRNSKDKVTTIVFGKQELNPEQLDFLRTLRFVSLKYNESLHAKCYFNDAKMIITSLNLYEFSMANNKEMGVLIDRADVADQQLLSDAMREVEFILGTSQSFALSSVVPEVVAQRPRESVPQPKAAKRAKSRPAPDEGHCLRCGETIPFDPDRPYCAKDYKAWAKWSNPDYEDEFCHMCGDDAAVSMNEPICADCDSAAPY